jgi:hypothetical protein
MSLSHIRLGVSIGAVLVTAAHAGYAQPWPPVPESWGKEVQGVRISISTTQPSRNGIDKAMALYVAVQNVGDTDVVVNLGHMLANGTVMFPDAMTLTLADPVGISWKLEFSDRRYAGIAGRVDDFTVPLRSGSVYVLRTFLDQWTAPKIAPGRYRVSARLRGEGARAINPDTEGIALMNFWKGVAESQAVEFDVSQQ